MYKRNVKIDLIKSFAVSLVIIYHIFPNLLPIGFIGVEFFLIVTGYLTAQTLERSNAKEFIIKRFWRIYPSLCTIILLTMTIVIFEGYSDEIYVNLKSAVIGSVLLSNFYYLFTSTDYFFVNDAEMFIHFWSIALEWQIWLFFAILTLLFKNKKLFFLFFLFFLLVNIFLLFQKSIFDEYFNPLRILFLPLLGYIIFSYNYKFNTTKRIYSLIYIILFFLLIYVVNSNFDLVGYYILLMLPLIVLVIDNKNSNKNITFLDKIFIFLSNRTYGLYLSHYPAWKYFSVYYNLSYGWVLALIVSFIYAELSYRYLEQ
jgi:peptidoglycan/LPS O-acetylase OafA/YrhL